MVRHPSQELQEAVAKEIEMFDPGDPYWKVNHTCILVSETGSVFFLMNDLNCFCACNVKNMNVKNTRS